MPIPILALFDTDQTFFTLQSICFLTPYNDVIVLDHHDMDQQAVWFLVSESRVLS